jgi:hypothetical protein
MLIKTYFVKLKSFIPIEEYLSFLSQFKLILQVAKHTAEESGARDVPAEAGGLGAGTAVEGEGAGEEGAASGGYGLKEIIGEVEFTRVEAAQERGEGGRRGKRLGKVGGVEGEITGDREELHIGEASMGEAAPEGVRGEEFNRLAPEGEAAGGQGAIRDLEEKDLAPGGKVLPDEGIPGGGDQDRMRWEIQGLGHFGQLR